tara:strand:+ start:6648 stop:7892 length:1245 start_codon:yes stop_codon:yes gene_type:complete
MANIKAFKAVRPTRDKAYLVASRSYLSYSENTLREKLLNNPYTFLHIINPEYSSNLPLVQGLDKYKLVKEKYEQFSAEGIFIIDKEPSFYIYQQISIENTYTGIIAATSVTDYLNGKIKIHEQTIAKRQEMFTEYLESTGFNAEPVLLSYNKVPRVNEIMGAYMKDRPEYEFTSTNKVLHNLWIINKQSDINEIQALFIDVDSLYIADGHHRSASSALLSKNRKTKQNSNSDEESHNYFMSLLIDDEQMRIYDFNRLVSDLNGLTIDELLLKVSDVYSIEKLDSARKPQKKDEIGMYVNGSWYSLIAKKHTFDSSHCVKNLDPEILSNNILSPILGVKDLRNDKRVGFMDGKKGLLGLQNSVDSGAFAIAFALKAITFNQLKTVADNGEIMPPKSTYIEPKLRSGLTIYSINDD